MRRSLVAAALAVALSPSLSTAQALPNAPQKETFVSAKPLERRAPIYPSAEVMNRREGWVLLSFVVSPQGKVEEAMIEDSSGNEGFERAAIRAVKAWQYEPAKMNGKPVEQSMVHTRIQFQMDNKSTGASRKFVKTFDEVQALIKAGDLAAADQMMTDLQYSERLNLYEDAWFWWLKFVYLDATGNAEADELAETLQKAIGYEEDYLPPDVFLSAAQRLYVIDVKDHDYSRARSAFERLRDSKAARKSDHYQEVVDALTPSFEQIEKLIDGDQILKIGGRIGAHGYWVHDLLKRSFSLAAIEGRVEAVDIRCEKGTSRFYKVSEDNVWNVPESWGRCGVYIKGETGTAFDFYEYPQQPAAG